MLSLWSLGWSGHSFCHTPPRFDAPPNQRCVCAEAQGRVLRGHAFSVHGHDHRFAGVQRLLAFGGPAAIFWRVWSVIVLAFQCAVARSLPHVGQKCFEAVTPTVTHRNAATAVSVIIGPFWTVASAAHIDPNLVLRRDSAAVRDVDGLKCCFGMFHVAAPTGNAASGSKVSCGSCDALRPARAVTVDCCPIAAHHGQSAIHRFNRSKSSAEPCARSLSLQAAA